MVLSFVALVFLATLRLGGRGMMLAAMPPPYGAGLISVLGVLTAVAIAVLLDRLLRLFYWDGYLRHKRKRETPALIEDIFTIALVVLGASIGLFFEAGVSFTGLLTASGATAIVLGIALQAVINDLFSGLSINFDGSYALDDWLTICLENVPEPVYGQVEGINWRTTFLRLNDGRRLMVANHLMTSNPVINHSRPSGPKRLIVEVPVSNLFPVDRAMGILLGEAYRVGRTKPLVTGMAPDILIDRFDSDSTFFHVRFYADPDEVNPPVARSIMAVALHRAVLRHNIPSPVNQVELTPATGKVDSQSMEAQSALAEVSVFKDVLNAQQLDTLFSRCNVRTLSAGTVFIHQGGTETSMFVILEGAAQVSISAAGGETREVTVLVDGDIVGEMSLMTGAPRTATVTSLTPMRLLEVTKESIEILLKATPGLLATFGRLLAKRQSNLNEIANATQLRVLAEPDIIARMQQFFSRVFG